MKQWDHQQWHLVIGREPMAAFLSREDDIQVIASLPLVCHHPCNSASDHQQKENHLVRLTRLWKQKLYLVYRALDTSGPA
jgi:hypothetical protein